MGDGNLRLLWCQGLRRRLLRHALLRAPPCASNHAPQACVPRPRACFAAPLAQPISRLLCALLTVCYVCCHVSHVLTGAGVHLGLRHGEGRSRLLLRLLPGPRLLFSMRALPGEG